MKRIILVFFLLILVSYSQAQTSKCKKVCKEVAGDFLKSFEKYICKSQEDSKEFCRSCLHLEQLLVDYGVGDSTSEQKKKCDNAFNDFGNYKNKIKLIRVIPTDNECDCYYKIEFVMEDIYFVFTIQNKLDNQIQDLNIYYTHEL